MYLEAHDKNRAFIEREIRSVTDYRYNSYLFNQEVAAKLGLQAPPTPPVIRVE